jgi:hypothetical protein
MNYLKRAVFYFQTLSKGMHTLSGLSFIFVNTIKIRFSALY